MKFLTCVDINGSKDYVVIECDSQKQADAEVWERFVEDVQTQHEYWAEPLTDANLAKARDDGFVTDHTSEEG